MADLDTFLTSVYGKRYEDGSSKLLSSEAPVSNRASHQSLVTLTYAQSLDAKIAGKGGRPIQLSGDASACMTHRLRACHTHILVGIGTLLNDDPQLNCRLPKLVPKSLQPIPCIMDAQLRTPLSCKLIRNAQEQRGHFPIVFTSRPVPNSLTFEERRRSLENVGCTVITLSPAGDGLPIEGVLQNLPLGSSLMVEGGASIISSFLYSGKVDHLIITIAPTLVGEDGVTAYKARLFRPHPQLHHVATTHFGRDTVVAYTIQAS